MPRIAGFVRDQYTNLPVPQPPADIADATYIVTGANSGLGFECAKHLVGMGAKRVVMAVRSRSKGEAALSAIRSRTGRRDAGEVWELDLASPDSVEAFARRTGELDRLDALIANAGVAMSDFELVEGVETTVMVNVVCTMLLAFRALPKLRESARRLGAPTRLVIVSSNTALEPEMESKVGSLRGDVFDALSVEKSFKQFDQLRSPPTALELRLLNSANTFRFQIPQIQASGDICCSTARFDRPRVRFRRRRERRESRLVLFGSEPECRNHGSGGYGRDTKGTRENGGRGQPESPSRGFRRARKPRRVLLGMPGERVCLSPLTIPADQRIAHQSGYAHFQG